MKIMQNLWQVGGGDITSPEDAAVYLIRFGQEAAIIDAGSGCAHKQLLANISAVLLSEIPIRYLFVTHCHYDHVGGAAALKDQYDCKIVAHHLDATYLEAGDSQVTAASWYGARMSPLKIDHKIRGTEERFEVGNSKISAYHCPGHSPGSLVYLTEIDEQKVLFSQDVHGPLDSSLLSNHRDYIESLQFMISLGADILCEGHFGIYRGRENINRFIRSFLNS